MRIVIVVAAALVLALSLSDALASRVDHRPPPAAGPRVDFQVCRVVRATRVAEAAGTATGETSFHLAFSDAAGDEEDVPVVVAGGRFDVSSTGRFPAGRLRGCRSRAVGRHVITVPGDP